MGLNPVTRGEVLTAELVNELIARVERGVTIRGGAGINVTRSGADYTLALAKILGEHVRPARIVARTGQAIDLAANIAYDVREYETQNQINGMTPAWGRPTRRDDVEIHAANVGSWCYLVREPQDDGTTIARLWIPAGGSEGETLAFFECGEAPTPAGGGGDPRRVVVSNKKATQEIFDPPFDQSGGPVSGDTGTGGETAPPPTEE
jgi:hypothetical protein